MIGILKPVLEKEFHWTESAVRRDRDDVFSLFAFGLLIFGRFVDKVGTKVGYTVSIVVWSIAAVAHAFAKSTFGFAAARAILGLGEAGNFPVAIKSVAEWFPKKERALATGIFNSGANIGAVAAPAVVPWLAADYGWQEAFIWTGVVGFVWLIFWIAMYEIPARHKKITKAEYDHIHSDNVDESNSKRKVPWLKLFGIRANMGFRVR